MDELARRLYEAPPDGFVAARSAAVADAKKSGDPQAAKQIAALRKPTVAAWLVNLLALRRPELIDELVELATALRDAQRGLRGDELRELSVQRRQVVSSLVAEAQKLAVASDPALKRVKLPTGEVEATLTAALAEPEIASQVRSGRLVKAATYAGFGEVPRPRLRLVTDAEPASAEPSSAKPDVDPALGDWSAPVSKLDERRHRAEEKALDDRRRRAEEKARAEREARRRELKRELTQARRAEEKATAALEQARGAESDAGHSIDEIEEQIAELERQRIVAQAELSRRKLARRSAERDASAARRRTGDVEAAIEDLDADEPV
ncbi:hypothetical protein [Symbioplanes lichenis]|uniref:hypothetical protein n=1 Tax=Symbioplanes lichenis TaxID=1629072 RepID=UPI002739266F|nr:hypothetical protein [Actinoplanes lichenis]